MDDKPLLNVTDRQGLIQRLKRLENEVEEIKKELGPINQNMADKKPPDCSECCRDCATCCILCSLCEVINRR
jgi:hypothetical protein